jgi:hypothetical protein
VWATRVLVALTLIFLIPAINYTRDFHAAVLHGYRTALWLATPVAKTPDGKLIVRAQLIDLALQREAAALQAEWLKKPAN